MRVEARVVNQAELVKILDGMSVVARSAFEMSGLIPTYLPALSKNPEDKVLCSKIILNCLQETIRMAEGKPLSYEEYPPELSKEEMAISDLTDYLKIRKDEETSRNHLYRIKQVLFTRRESLCPELGERGESLKTFSLPEQIPDELAITCAKKILTQVKAHGLNAFL